MKNLLFIKTAKWLLLPIALIAFCLECMGASVSMSTTVKIFPNGSTTVANGVWKSACSASQGYWTGDKTFSTPGGSLNFNGNAGDNNNDYKCQLKAGQGVITTTITSSYGVDVEVSARIKQSGGEITISLTTSSDPDTETCTSTTFNTYTVSTTSTSATLTISNTGTQVGGVQYIKITPKAGSTKTLFFLLQFKFFTMSMIILHFFEYLAVCTFCDYRLTQ